MRLGVKVNLTITDAKALRNEGFIAADRNTTEDEAIRLLFTNPSSTTAFKVEAIDVQGTGSKRVVKVVADIRNKDNLVRDANDLISHEGLCQEEITSPFRAFQALAISMNNYTCRAQIGVSFDDGVPMNNTDIRRVLGRAAQAEISP